MVQSNYHPFKDPKRNHRKRLYKRRRHRLLSQQPAKRVRNLVLEPQRCRSPNRGSREKGWIETREETEGGRGRRRRYGRTHEDSRPHPTPFREGLPAHREAPSRDWRGKQEGRGVKIQRTNRRK